MNWAQLIPSELLQFLLALALSFLIGLQREEVKHGKDRDFYSFGGVRTFPMIGLFGFWLAKLSEANPAALGLGLATLGSFLWLSYRKKLEMSSAAGMTTEVSGLITYLIGVLVYRQDFWAAVTTTVVLLLLLELKEGLERMAHKIPPEEIFTFTRFLLLTAVILPVVPDQDFSPFHLNPHQMWLMVVVISSMSYLSYLINIFSGNRKSILLSGLLGGLYSSTLTTVMLAKQARGSLQPRMYSGAILLASGIMYFRVLSLIAIFNMPLAQTVGLPFLLLGSLGCLVGWWWSNGTRGVVQDSNLESKNPLELRFALLFMVLYVTVMVVSGWVSKWAGASGIYLLSAISGFTDVDPFVMSMSQSAGQSTAVKLAAGAVIVATSSNHLLKGLYSYFLSDGKVKRQAALFLLLYSGAGLLALFFL